MKPANLCTGCYEDFSSLKGFDVHRVGKSRPRPSTPARSRTGREKGRPCLTTEGLEELGLSLDGNGRWQLPVSEKQRASLDRLKAAKAAA
jgi:hypothetical protein